MPNRAERRKALQEAWRLAHKSKDSNSSEPTPEVSPEPKHRLDTTGTLRSPASRIAEGNSIQKQVVAWVVIGGVIFLFLGAGFTFMTASLQYHVWIADACFSTAALLFVVKFWTWEETRRESTLYQKNIIAKFFIGAIAVLGALIGSNHYLNFSTKIDIPPPQTGGPDFIVDERASFLAMTRDVLYAMPFMVAYIAGKGETWFSPVAAMVWVDVTNNTNVAQTIKSYSLAVHTDRCGWVYLVPIPTTMTAYYTGLKGYLQNAKRVDFSRNGLDVLMTNAVEPHHTLSGWLLFDSRDKCIVNDGDSVEWKISLTTFGGINFDQEPKTQRINNSALLSYQTERFTTGPKWYVEGPAVDLGSPFHLRFFSDPPEPIK